MTIAPPQGARSAGRPAPLMAAARAVASDETVELSRALLAQPVERPRPGSGDPIYALVERLRVVAAHAVDPLQVAARLEADGLTDRVARVEYGFDDVFAVAEEVFRRLKPGPPAPRPAPRRREWRSGVRDIAHGLLYLMPSVLFPAVLAAVGRGPLVTALVLTGGLGWAWSGGASWLAYQRLGAGAPAGAARALRGSVCWGLPAAALLGVLVAGTGVGWGVGLTSRVGYGLVGLCVGQMAYQLASMLLVFYRREGLLAASMAPAVLSGGGFVLLGGAGAGGWQSRGGLDRLAHVARPQWLMLLALGLGVAAVLIALGLGLRETARATAAAGADGAASPTPAARKLFRRWRRRSREDVSVIGRSGERGAAGKVGAGNRAGVRADLPGLIWATAYAALSAAYLLHAQARYLTGQLDVAVAAVPLLAGMGVVEWRARRFGALARAALARVRYPREFTRRLWLLLFGGVAVSTGVVAVLAVPVLLLLAWAGRLGPAAVLMAAAHAVLAGAYFLSFLLAGQRRYAALCAVTLAAGVLHTLGGWLLGAGTDPVLDTGLFLGSALLLQLFWAVLLARTTQPWHYR